MNPMDISLTAAYFGKTPPRQKFAYHANGQVEYHGIAPRGRDTSDAEWYVIKVTYNGSAQITDITSSPPLSVWDDYLTLSYQ